MKMNVLKRVGYPMIAITIIFLLFGILFVRDRSKKLTRGIIRLYETLQEICNDMAEDQTKSRSSTGLRYRAQSQELNEL